MEKGRWKRKGDEEDEDKDENGKVTRKSWPDSTRLYAITRLARPVLHFIMETQSLAHPSRAMRHARATDSSVNMPLSTNRVEPSLELSLRHARAANQVLFLVENASQSLRLT
ncbi:hypothetical protein JCGZ_03726 [Jatropha curcas]|uniref:Uncharacterized protein n=1 Tax=Jatropha curcas TaxID=180498 RepID=A0A067L5Q7_JATCU|nr:hypothetical protein JCGZ_03726 [Jatropha curcas]